MHRESRRSRTPAHGLALSPSPRVRLRTKDTPELGGRRAEVWTTEEGRTEEGRTEEAGVAVATECVDERANRT